MTSTRGPTGRDPTAGSRTGSLTSRLNPSSPVLVVEDEHDIANFLRAYFRASGQEVLHVDPQSAEQVADAVSEHGACCVLLDLHLRGFSGLEALHLIRAGLAVRVAAPHRCAARGRRSLIHRERG